MNDTSPKHRFHAPHLAAGEVALAGGEAHHALHVLRLKASSAVELFDGRGRRAAGVVTGLSRREVSVKVDRVVGPLERSRPLIHLAFSPPKAKRLNWLLEKTAELGVASLRPIRCRRTVAMPDLSSAARERWEAICTSAVRQSAQVYLPEILPPVSLDELLAAGDIQTGLLTHARPPAQPLRQIAGKVETTSVTLLIGPEGGWTDEEVEAALAAGMLAVRLGSTTLRVETAAVALMAGIIALLGE